MAKELGADATIAHAVSPRPFEQAFDSLARGGTLIMVALPPDNFVKLPIFETVLRGINIKGSIVGTHADVEDVFKLHTLGRTRVLHETRPLDGLTGTRARATGLEHIASEVDRARRTMAPLVVAYVDVVGLKAVNDSLGHAAGDALLHCSAQWTGSA